MGVFIGINIKKSEENNLFSFLTAFMAQVRRAKKCEVITGSIPIKLEIEVDGFDYLG